MHDFGVVNALHELTHSTKAGTDTCLMMCQYQDPFPDGYFWAALERSVILPANCAPASVGFTLFSNRISPTVTAFS